MLWMVKSEFHETMERNHSTHFTDFVANQLGEIRRFFRHLVTRNNHSKNRPRSGFLALLLLSFCDFPGIDIDLAVFSPFNRSDLEGP